MKRMITILALPSIIFVTSCSSMSYDEVPPPKTFDYYDCMSGVKTALEFKEREAYCKTHFN